jgi:hypothetical protein
LSRRTCQTTRSRPRFQATIWLAGEGGGDKFSLMNLDPRSVFGTNYERSKSH